MQQCVFVFHQLMTFLPEEEKRTINFHLGLGCSSVKIGTAMVVVSVCEICTNLFSLVLRAKPFKVLQRWQIHPRKVALARVSLGFLRHARSLLALFWEELTRRTRRKKRFEVRRLRERAVTIFNSGVGEKILSKFTLRIIIVK